jgi:hypothetical protein
MRVGLVVCAALLLTADRAYANVLKTAGTQSVNAAEFDVLNGDGHFSLRIPMTAVVQSRRSDSENKLYHVRFGEGEEPLLTIHFGTSVSFPFFASGVEAVPIDAARIFKNVREVRFHGHHGKETVWTSDNGARGRELLSIYAR